MPKAIKKMTASISSFVQRGKSFLGRSDGDAPSDSDFNTASEGTLFPKVDPAVDGEDCEQDCESCTIKYPAKFKIDEDEKLYGHVKGWATHMLVATGKTDWTRDVEDEKGSVMEAMRDCGVKPSNGVSPYFFFPLSHPLFLPITPTNNTTPLQRVMLSASNIPLPASHHDTTTVLLLPSFTFISNVSATTVPLLITHHISPSLTNTTPLNPQPTLHPANNPTPSPFTTSPCPHNYLLLLCSQKTRDARCGQSAPLLRREFERHLRPLGLYRDLHDERPGGVGIYFISHVGGHKFSANVMVYRKQAVRSGGVEGAVKAESDAGDGEEHGQAGQCIWLARVRPEDCEGIVKFTVLQGKVVKPERQLRGGFDRERGVCSW
ncbi:hypothetical protein MMC20_006218 [Loxospora ochrophaea]|nr:hypothetical protein [Loxospora ochrophaea]